MKDIEFKESGVIYEPEGHTYTLDGRQLQGITGTLINRAYPKNETYKDVPDDVLNHAAERGSACHQAVDNFFELGIPSTGYERTTEEAANLLKSKGLTPIRFEYVVTDYQRYASPIDIVCIDKDGNIAIVDMKFTNKLLCEQVTLQTSIYKRFFHIVNPDLEAKSLYVLHIHTNDQNEIKDSGIYELTPVSDEFIDDLIKADQADVPFSIDKYYGDFPAKIKAVENYLLELDSSIRAKTEEMNTIKQGILRLALENGVKNYSYDKIRITTITPKPRITFDSKTFKEDHPDLFRQYSNTSEVKPSLRLTIVNWQK